MATAGSQFVGWQGRWAGFLVQYWLLVWFRLELVSGVIRVCHGYRKTCRFKVMGLASTGTVPDLAYLCHGITGMYRYITG